MYSSSFSLKLDGGEWSTPSCDRVTPQEWPSTNCGWAPRTVCNGADKLFPTWIWSPDRPAHGESQYRLRYPCTFCREQG